MALTSRVVHSGPDILGGILVFVRTRVPMRTLLNYLEAGDSLEVFLDDFPSVSREQAIAALELAKKMLTAYAEEISRRMSHLNLAQVYAALAYYHANCDEIEADLAEEDAEYWKLAALHSKRV